MSNEVGRYYSDNLEKLLKEKLNEFVDKIEKFIKDKSIEDRIVLNNSVYKSIIPFSYKSRVKDSLSIEEKIIRNDIRFQTISNEDLLTKFDDLIGVTILTTTIGFQDIALKYLKLYIEENSQFITEISGLDNKKKIFNNETIKYYHIKLKYCGYPIEIQIKSIFLSAFADIEHTLFYKDYEIHELKNYNKKIMYSLAPMLINIEEILHDIYTYDTSYIESEAMRTKIYSYIESRKNEIFEVTNDNGRLNFVVNQISQILFSYLKETKIEFKEEIFSEGMTESNDKKIIDHFFKESLSFNAITKVLNNSSDFFRNYLLFELRSNENYHEKIDLVSSKIDILLDTMLHISSNEIFKNTNIKKSIKLIELYQHFESSYEDFMEKFQDILEHEQLKDELEELVNSSLILNNIISQKEELTSDISENIKKWLQIKEDEDRISYELSEKILKYILEGWNK